MQTGQKFKTEMEAKINKWQEPPPAKTVKPLDKPDAEVRGGVRVQGYGVGSMVTVLSCSWSCLRLLSEGGVQSCAV